MRNPRPVWLKILVAIQLIGGLLGVVGAQSLFFIDGSAAAYGYARVSGFILPLGIVLLILGIMGLYVAVGLWRGRGWARTLALVLGGVGIILSLLFIFLVSVTNVIGVIIDTAVVYYLTRGHVKRFFGKGPVETVPSIAAQPPAQWYSRTLTSSHPRGVLDCTLENRPELHRSHLSIWREVPERLRTRNKGRWTLHIWHS